MATHGLGKWYVEIEKQAYWRGAPKTWVNRYVMTGADPTTSNATAVINGLKAIEDVVYPQVNAGVGVGFVEGRAYGAGGGAPLTVVNYNADLVAGTATGWTGPGTGDYASLQFGGTLENCLDVVTLMNGLSTSGKPVYCRKFFRGIINVDEAENAGIAEGDRTQVATHTLPWKTGVGGTAYVVTTVDSRLAQGVPTAQEYIGNHQVPRGRKRSTSSSVAAAAFATGALVGASAQTSSGQPRDIFGDRGGFQFPPTL